VLLHDNNAWLCLVDPLLLCIGPSRSARAQQPETSGAASNALLNTDQIVENVARMNRERAQALPAYHGTRFYRVEYRGVPGAHSAEMEVNVAYQSPQTKEFTIRWTTGSKVIIDSVFKKFLQAEREELREEIQSRSALNGNNYIFSLVGYERAPSGSMYVLVVEPSSNWRCCQRCHCYALWPRQQFWI
jgi:hypothetical protein